MKKNIYYSVIALLLSTVFYACDTDVEPNDAVEEPIILEDVENTELILEGNWRYLWDTYSTYRNPGWNALLLTNDAMGDDVAMRTAAYGYGAQYQFTEVVASNSGFLNHIWQLGYKSIDNMNIILSAIDKIPGDDTKRNRIKAQAATLRGYLYFNLATSWGEVYAKDPTAPSIPIYTEPTTTKTEGKPKSPLNVVYKQVEDDLLMAYNLIGNYSNNGVKYRITKPIISGLLARYYLQTSQWEKAQKFANEAQSSVEWMIKSDYAAGFNDYSNSEWIWGHGQTVDQNVASYSFNYKDVYSKSSYYYSFMADPYFKDNFADYDIRTDLFEYDTTRFVGALMYKKFLFKSNNTADIVIMRKAEQVLIEAESYAELGNLSAAISKLNELRTARLKEDVEVSVLPNLNGLTKEQLIDEILLERRKELFGEGFALNDIRRRQQAVKRKPVPNNTPLVIDGKTIIKNGTVVTIKGHTTYRDPDGKNFTANSPYYRFVIPLSEDNNNPNLNKY